MTAHSYGKSATYMPKPIVGDNGSGMHVHQSIWKDGRPLFAGSGYADLSDMALYYIGGVIRHARRSTPSPTRRPTATSGWCRATRRRCCSPTRRATGPRPAAFPTRPSPNGKRVEVRFPDPSANPYLAFAAMLMAGIDGIENKIHPGDAMDKNLYDLPPEELKDVPTVCGNLGQALDALDADRDFLKKGDVFSDDLIDGYLELKREEQTAFLMAPHPIEFEMYYSV